MKTLAEFIRATAIIAADPNDDPQELFSQVRPLLIKMGLAGLANRNKTQLILGSTQGKNSRYCIELVRKAQITADIIDRIKRNEEYFNYIVWNAKAMEVYVWYQYIPPEEKGPRPGLPGAPGAGNPA